MGGALHVVKQEIKEKVKLVNRWTGTVTIKYSLTGKRWKCKSYLSLLAWSSIVMLVKYVIYLAVNQSLMCVVKGFRNKKYLHCRQNKKKSPKSPLSVVFTYWVICSKCFTSHFIPSWFSYIKTPFCDSSKHCCLKTCYLCCTVLCTEPSETTD